MANEQLLNDYIFYNKFQKFSTFFVFPPVPKTFRTVSKSCIWGVMFFTVKLKWYSCGTKGDVLSTLQNQA